MSYAAPHILDELAYAFSKNSDRLRETLRWALVNRQPRSRDDLRKS